MDKGRYLVVSLTSGERADVERASGACSVARPVPENTYALRMLVRGPQQAISAVSAITDMVSQPPTQLVLSNCWPVFTPASLSSEFTSAADWARSKLQSFGSVVSTHTVTVGGSMSSNLVADKPGTGANRQLSGDGDSTSGLHQHQRRRGAPAPGVMTTPPDQQA